MRKIYEINFLKIKLSINQYQLKEYENYYIYIYKKQNITIRREKMKMSEGLPIQRLIHFLQLFPIGGA